MDMVSLDPAMMGTNAASVITRVATFDDLGQVMALLIWMGRENAAFSQNVEKATRYIADSISKGLTIVVIDDGKVVGCCALARGSSVWYSDDEILGDYAFYLHPDHRTFKAAKALVNHCKMLSDLSGVPLALGVHSTVDADRKMALFDRMLTRVGAAYIHVPERA